MYFLLILLFVDSPSQTKSNFLTCVINIAFSTLRASSENLAQIIKPFGWGSIMGLNENINDEIMRLNENRSDVIMR